jgi:hypothetical protein
MDTPEGGRLRSTARHARYTDAAFKPPIYTQDIFHQLILEEIRQGRMTTTRRRQIMRYAREMRVSPSAVDRLINSCRNEMLQSPDPEERRRARDSVRSDPDGVPRVLTIANTLGAILVGYLLLLRWFI